jgi:hypothetical protein
MMQRIARDGLSMMRLQGYLCPASSGQVCRANLEDPQYGYQGFDNFLQNLLLVYQVSYSSAAAI